MHLINRRQFAGAIAAIGAQARRALGAPSLDETLRGGIERRKIPCVTAMVASDSKIIYSGAFGTRDAASGVAVKPDSLFAIASMTKEITSTAAMQLVEQGKVTLDEPV